MAVLFGPAGIPIACEGGTFEGVECCSQLGLTAMEVEFVQGVKMGLVQADKIGKRAEELKIRLSCHCPYFINFCGKEKAKLLGSVRNVMDTARVAQPLGASAIVFHPGFYMGRTPQECAKIAKPVLQECIDKLKAEKLDKVWLAPETTGKKSQYGSLDDVLDICSSLERCRPTVDFGHMHARESRLRSKQDFLRIFERIEKALGKKAVHDLHVHFSELEYTEAGEYRHIPLGTNEPPFKPLAEAIVENGFGCTIISESPLLEQDSLKMKKIYEAALAAKK